MQSINSNVTWINFWIEFVKILGPASVALIGTYIGLRSQRKIKEIEIDSQTRLKARELMFNAYQKKADSENAELKEACKIFNDLYLKVSKMRMSQTENNNDIIESFEKSLTVLSTISVPLHSSFEELESELKHFNLLIKYEDELKTINSFASIISQPPQDLTIQNLELTLNIATSALSHIMLIHNEILEKKREQLFEEYLPKRIREK